MRCKAKATEEVAKDPSKVEIVISVKLYDL